MFAGHTVHNLDPLWPTGNSTQQPFAPCPSIIVIAGVHQGDEREGGVP